MQMPGRHGFATESGDWHGSYAFSIPPYLFVDHRAGNTPLEYVASQTIELSNGFLTGAGSDNYVAYIADSASMATADSAYQLVANGYRYGFNGQEHSTELGNDDYTAQFWEYDSRSGRRWNVDPKASLRYEWTPYGVMRCNPIKNIDPDGDFDDDYLIRKDGEIVVRKTDDSFDRFYTENNQRIDGSIIIRNYSFVAKLDKNDAGLVNFPDNGIGFTSYGATEKGGYSSGIKKGVSFKENVGSGDSYLKPQTAAALFGVIDGLHDKGITVSLGDMSSSNGSDPANAGKNTFHHAGHGHMTKRSGLDADFRYIGKNGSSFQGVMSNKKFNVKNNQTLYNLAKQFGFDPQNTYQGTSARIPGVKKMGGHNNHGHLGMKRKPTNFTPYKPYVQK